MVSVITSSFNCGPYLSDHVRSVEKQVFGDWEHIVVDCGSSDGSWNLLQGLAHKRLKSFTHPPCGVAEARAIAISHARGEFCAVLDADDTAGPTRLVTQVDLLAKNPSVVAVGGSYVAILNRPKSLYTALRREVRTVSMPTSFKEMRILIASALNPIPHSTLMFRRDAYDKLGGYRPLMEKAEDFDLVIRFSEIGEIVAVSECVSNIRFGRQGSHTVRHKPQGRDDVFYALLAVLSSIARSNRLAVTEKAIEGFLSRRTQREIHALQGHWALRALCENAFNGSRSLKRALGRLILNRCGVIVPSGRLSAFWKCSSGVKTLEVLNREQLTE